MTAGRNMSADHGAASPLRRLRARLGGVLRRLDGQLTSLNARMEGESACRRCGICHHVCGMLTPSRRSGGLSKE